MKMGPTCMVVLQIILFEWDWFSSHTHQHKKRNSVTCKLAHGVESTDQVDNM